MCLLHDLAVSLTIRGADVLQELELVVEGICVGIAFVVDKLVMPNVEAIRFGDFLCEDFEPLRNAATFL